MKILHITYGFNGGGVGFVIANYCANQPMPGIVFDIVGESIGKPHFLQERFEKAGVLCHAQKAKPAEKYQGNAPGDSTGTLRRGACSF